KVVFFISVLLNKFAAEAIRCHECNSHLEEDCTSLSLSTPHGGRDNTYLRECTLQGAEDAFCRKTVTTIEATGEKRVVRSCGWIKDNPNIVQANSCFNADNEGYLQTICTCDNDGCNAAPSLFTFSKHSIFMVALTSLSLLFATIQRRSG
ncbi:uncharacterized protein LOC119689637, partial [Teleopsis dalmanni]|uniref:uncharacterized protein LOC119689637 n=1 Tax=Teleopsis dalmanni TaxID=139649 RepID=UPI0018CF4EE4